MSEEIPDNVKFIVGLMGASANQTASTIDAVAKNMCRDYRQTEARLALVRAEILRLMAGDYMPMPHLVTNALYPREGDVSEWLNAHYGPEWKRPETPFRRCYSCHYCNY